MSSSYTICGKYHLQVYALTIILVFITRNLIVCYGSYIFMILLLFCLWTHENAVQDLPRRLQYRKREPLHFFHLRQLQVWNASYLRCIEHDSSYIVHPYPKSARSGTTTSALRCPKCGAAKKSGKLSCCARGGAWFKNCGDVGDMKFDHTWAEGFQACKSKL